MLDRLASNELTAGLQRNHAPALFAMDRRGERRFELSGDFKCSIELREAHTDALPALVFGLHEPVFPPEGNISLQKHSHTGLSGAPGVLGPSECRPELPGDGAKDVSAFLHNQAEKLTYDIFTVVFRSLLGDRNSNSAVICDARSKAAA